MLITRSLQLLRDNNPKNRSRFLKVVDTCNAFSPLTRLNYIFNGKKFLTYSTHDEILQAWSKANGGYGRAGQGSPFMLATDNKNEFFVLGTLDDLNMSADVSGIEFSFNVSKPLLKPEGYISFNECREFFIAVINSYEAYAAYIHDSDLQQLTTFGFVNRVIREQIPKDQWKYIPTPEIVNKIPATLAGRLSNVFPPEQFNRLEVPEAIYWFNYWNPYMVEHVGEKIIRTAPVEVIEKQKNGGYILVIQKENFDTGNISHLEKLAKAYDHFNLADLQQKNLFK